MSDPYSVSPPPVPTNGPGANDPGVNYAPGTPTQHHASPAQKRSPLGLASLVVSIIAVLLTTAAQAFAANFVMVSAGGYQQIGLIYAVSGGIGSILAIVALVLGIIALTKRTKPRLAAAAGTGISSSFLFTTVMAYASTALVGILANVAR